MQCSIYYALDTMWVECHPHERMVNCYIEWSIYYLEWYGVYVSHQTDDGLDRWNPPPSNAGHITRCHACTVKPDLTPGYTWGGQ